MMIEGKIGAEEVSRLLGKSQRQVHRIKARVETEGSRGVIHRNRGRQPKNKGDEGEWQRVMRVIKEKYVDVNDRHLREILEREEGITVGRESLRKRLRAAGIGPKRKRRRNKYRSRRERKAAFGVMLQIDGSPHDWLEGRGERLTLVGAKDDATGYCWGRFVQAETTWAYMGLMREIFLKTGLPMSLYSDKHSIFDPRREATIIEQLNGNEPMTQFGRAMHELGIGIIRANSPQAKGRIERQWGISQDRLAVELRLASASTIEEANLVLDRFLVDYNRRFTVKPKEAEWAFRTAPRARELDRILCLKETRTVNNDHTIGYEGLTLQLPRMARYASIAGSRVEVLQLRSGDVEVIYKGQVVLRLTPGRLSEMIGKGRSEKKENKVVGSKIRTGGGVQGRGSAPSSAHQVRHSIRPQRALRSRIQSPGQLTFSLGH